LLEDESGQYCTVCAHVASYSCSLALQPDSFHSPFPHRDESSWQRLPLESPNALAWIRPCGGSSFSRFSLAYSSGSTCSGSTCSGSTCSGSPSHGWESCINYVTLASTKNAWHCRRISCSMVFHDLEAASMKQKKLVLQVEINMRSALLYITPKYLATYKASPGSYQRCSRSVQETKMSHVQRGTLS
jgi:hypothetical protein